MSYKIFNFTKSYNPCIDDLIYCIFAFIFSPFTDGHIRSSSHDLVDHQHSTPTPTSLNHVDHYTASSHTSSHTSPHTLPHNHMTLPHNHATSSHNHMTSSHNHMTLPHNHVTSSHNHVIDNVHQTCLAAQVAPPNSERFEPYHVNENSLSIYDTPPISNHTLPRNGNTRVKETPI